MDQMLARLLPATLPLVALLAPVAVIAQTAMPPVVDRYNMYFSPDGASAIVVAEARKRLDFRDPQTMKLQYSINTPNCAGINHADFSIDGTFAIFTCEFNGGLVKVDLVARKVMGY